MKSIFTIILVLLLAGCTTMQSIRVYTTETPEAGPGISGYFLPKALIKLQAFCDKSGNHRIKYIDTVFYPDPNHFYLLKYKPSVTSNDNIVLTQTSTGLLKTVNVTATEETGNIIINLAKAVATAVTPPPLKMALEVPIEKLLYDAEFDPTDKGEMDRFIQELKKLKCNERLNVKIYPEPNSPDLKPSPTSASGVFFRPLLPYKLTLTDEISTTELTVLLPNKAPVLSIDLSRAMFVTKVSDIEFNNGILTKVTIKKPSEVLAVASIPIEIAKAIVAIPAELIQIKINTASKEKALLESEKARLELEKELWKLKKEMQGNMSGIDN